MITAPFLRCSGCGAAVEGPLPYRCPEADRDGGDHVLSRIGPPVGAVIATEGDPNPFIRYRTLSYSFKVAQAHGLGDEDYVALVRKMDGAVASVDGRGFRVTPYLPSAKVAKVLPLEDKGLWIKDETGNVAGSHKARHLFGLAIHQAVAERLGLIGAADASRPLAIASCGNAALAAGVVARAAGRELRVFVPPWADQLLIERLRALGASIETCERRSVDPPGDPCHLRFREAVKMGALPFSVQGSDNGLAIDGGMTLGFELAAQSADVPIDRLLIQVGGGALASSVIQGLDWAYRLGLLPKRPAIHAVQTASGFPLIRAWRRVARALIAELGGAVGPGEDLSTGTDASRGDATAARWLSAHADARAMEGAIAAAARDRARFMWPWQTEPKSLATGILDDETYDWLAIVRGMLVTGGWPMVATESNILEAYCEGRAAPIVASATGAAGLAGAMTMAEAGLLSVKDRVAVIFTGIDR